MFGYPKVYMLLLFTFCCLVGCGDTQRSSRLERITVDESLCRKSGGTPSVKRQEFLGSTLYWVECAVSKESR